MGDSLGMYRRLRDLREDNELTQQDVAGILGTSPQYYQKYESGVRPISCQIIDQSFENITKYIHSFQYHFVNMYRAEKIILYLFF